MSTLRNQILGATLAVGTAFGAVVTPAAANEQDNIQLAAANLRNDDFSEENRKYVHNFPKLTQDAAEEASKNGVVLHIGDKFSYLLADTLKDELNDLGYNAQVALGGPESELRLMVNGKSGSKLFNFENAFTYLVETVQDVAQPTRKLSQSGGVPIQSLN